jgi:hypothetical protein
MRLGKAGSLVLLAMVLGFGVTVTGLAVRGNQATDNARVAQLADDATAEAILSHSLPKIRDLTGGLFRSALTISEAPPQNVPRHINQSWAIGGRNLALLTVWRGTTGHADGSQTILGGHVTYVASRAIFDGTTDVSYAWDYDGLAHILHVNLGHGLSREDADRIAGSVK